MKRVTIGAVPANTLPDEWRKQADLRGDELVSVTIDKEKVDTARELIELAREMSEHARRQGLTTEMLEEILREKV
jgi:DNA-binding phage protein